ncbi:MAG: hypothetical protein QM703_02425 [Gemmatales bacterium]
MTRFRWTLLLLLVFLTVFGTVLWWPVSPMWTQHINLDRIVGFTHAGKSVMALEVRDQTYDVVLYDVETGRFIQRKTMEFEKDWHAYWIELLPDGKHFISVEAYVDPTPRKVEDEDVGLIIRPKRYHVLDVDTHQVVAGPFIYSNDNSMTFSPDGRWFWSYYPGEGGGHDVIETMTGKTLFSARRGTGRWARFGRFSPESTAIAIHWFDYKTTKRHEIEVLDLPSAKTRFTFVLPDDLRYTWVELRDWKEGRLFMEAHQAWKPPKAYKTLIKSFPLLADKLGEIREEPQLEGFFDDRNGQYQNQQRYFERGDRLIEYSQGTLDESPDWLSESLAWLKKKFSDPLSRPPSTPTRLSFFDRQTGQLLYCFTSPHHWWHWEIRINPDGRRVATMDRTNGLMMWNADPFPRWPWAWSLGLLAVGLLQWAKWRWKKRGPVLE